MGLFDFVKGLGRKNEAAPVEQPQATPVAQPTAPAASQEPTAQQMANKLLGLLQTLNLGISGLSVSYNADTDTATLRGQAPSQEAREKAILAVGNIDHVAKVDDQLTVTSNEPQSQFYTVQSGDTLSKIAERFYGNASEYNKIFEANRPMLNDPDHIFVGQQLRIPQ